MVGYSGYNWIVHHHHHCTESLTAGSYCSPLEPGVNTIIICYRQLRDILPKCYVWDSRCYVVKVASDRPEAADHQSRAGKELYNVISVRVTAAAVPSVSLQSGHYGGVQLLKFSLCPVLLPSQPDVRREEEQLFICCLSSSQQFCLDPRHELVVDDMACVGVWPNDFYNSDNKNTGDFYDKSASDGFESSSDAESDSAVLEYQQLKNEENDTFGVNMIVQEMENILKRSKLISRLKSLNNLDLKGVVNEDYLPFVCDDATVGLVPPEVVVQVKQFHSVFTITKDRISFSEEMDTVESRSRAFNSVILELRDKGMFSNALLGWRNECYEIRNKFSDPTLFYCERAASPLFGVRKYGVQINGYVRHSTLGMCLWLQQRSLLKPTWPGMMDNFVGGGVTEGLSVAETAVKEAAEEAGVDEVLAAKLLPCGSISFLHKTDRGIHPNTEFVFDLELPEHFVPINTDGEVGGWTLVPVEMIVDVICSDKFKITSTPVVIDFLVRWGYVTPDQELLDLLRFPLDILYKYFNILQ